jgi:hypothetical protein
MPCAAQLPLSVESDRLRQAEKKLGECPELSWKGGSTQRSYMRLGYQRKPILLLLQHGVRVPLSYVSSTFALQVPLHEVPSALKVWKLMDVQY